jgi:carbon storage regulator CsrA
VLVLARKNKESVVIAASDNSHELVRVTVVDICEGRVKLGFEADRGVPIHREEIWERVRAESHASQLSNSMTNNHEGQSV